METTIAPPLSATVGRATVRPLTRSILIVAVLTFVGGCVRFLPAWQSGFVYGDGGLFVLMVEELRAGRYSLPLTTAYNHLDIPFAYPPLGLYLAAALADVTGIPVLMLARWLPPLIATLTVPACYRLACTLHLDRRTALIATGAFALLPHASMLFVEGGGLTRAWGLLFALLTLAATADLYRTGDWRRVGPIALFGALTVLSHPSAAWFTVYSGVLLFAICGRNRRALRQSVTAALVVALATAPWWGLVIVRHGWGTLVSAATLRTDYAEKLAILLDGQVAGEAFLPILWSVALLGLTLEFRRRHPLLPFWFALVYLIDARYALAYASVPLALLIGRGLAALVPFATARRAFVRIPVSLVLGMGLGLVLVGALLVPSTYTPHLSTSDLAGMRWVHDFGPADATYAVIEDQGHGRDAISEWFPALTGQVSVATTEGSEWLPGAQFVPRWSHYALLQQCAGGGLPCLESRHAEMPFTHVFVARSTQTVAIEVALRQGTRYRLIHEEADAAIYERIDQRAEAGIVLSP